MIQPNYQDIKSSISSILGHLSKEYDLNLSETVSILENELRIQSHFDTREVDPTVIDLQWNQASRISPIVDSDIKLKHSLEVLSHTSYAFRMMFYGQILKTCSSQPRIFEALDLMLKENGHFLDEVKSYISDFC